MLRRFAHGSALRTVVNGFPLLTAPHLAVSSASVAPLCGQVNVRHFSSTFIAAARGQGHPSATGAVRRYLNREHTLLGAGCLSAGVGSALMCMTPLGMTVPSWLPMAGMLLPLGWLHGRTPQSPVLKLGLFFSFTVMTGMAVAPLMITKGVPAIILTAVVFRGFSAAAFLAPRASVLALQLPLYAMVLGLAAISVLNIFYPTAFAHSLMLYGGLALFSVFLSVMRRRRRFVARDHVLAAGQVFFILLNIFFRLAFILSGD